MTVRELLGTFSEISAKPKDGWMVSVIEKWTSRSLMNDNLGDFRHAKPYTLDRVIKRWWIANLTIFVLAEPVVKRKVHVVDDWYPCFPGDTIELKVGMFYFQSYYVKLSAWGADDTGVEIEKTAEKLPEAVALYDELMEKFNQIPEGVDMKWFLDSGFSRF